MVNMMDYKNLFDEWPDAFVGIDRLAIVFRDLQKPTVNVLQKVYILAGI